MSNVKVTEIGRNTLVETEYETFSVERLRSGSYGVYGIYNSNGELLRKCKTKKECIERVKNQTV